MVADEMIWFWAKLNKQSVWKTLNAQQENGYEKLTISKISWWKLKKIWQM